MIDNIQKLYEVAGVEKLVEQWYNASIYGTTENCIEMAHKWSKENGIKIKNLTVLNDEKICFDKVYHPPFTAEKQLELIKWIGSNIIGYFYSFEDVNGRSTNFGDYCLGFEDTFKRYFYRVYHKHFDQALAGLILQLWDELSSEQREEVKDILQ